MIVPEGKLTAECEPQVFDPSNKGPYPETLNHLPNSMVAPAVHGL